MVATPCPEGPRHSGQSAAATFKEETAAEQMQTARRATGP
jgi:hypothetical protein